MRELTRSELFGRYIIENNSTIRKTAEFYKISKSTVHNDVSHKLPYINRAMYLQVKKILDKNFEEKHIRGGMSTKNKYLHIM